MANKPTAGQLASIAAQFMIAGDKQEKALSKANSLYFGVVKYLKAFNAMTPGQQAVDIDDEDAVRELLEADAFAIGDSEKSSPALDHFRRTAKTKTERTISHKAFISLIERECGRVPERIAPSVLMQLHRRLRARRSRARSERRKKK